MTVLQHSKHAVDTATPRFKVTNSDFQVFEAPVCSPSRTEQDARYTYLQLRKSGFTTFEAIELLARHLNCTHEQIQIAGLKDEDGITTQTLAVDGAVHEPRVQAFNEQHCTHSDHFIELSIEGSGNESILLGGLVGNYFTVTLRAINPEHWDIHRQLLGRPYATFFMLNYYDTQRFGVPGSPQTTHLIGKAILEGDYDKAYSLLVEAGTPESVKAQAWPDENDQRGFFSSLPSRVTNFFKSAHHSAMWNRRLNDFIIATYDRRDCEIIQVLEGCALPRNPSVSTRLLSARPSIDYVTYKNGEAIQSRDTLSQIRLRAGDLTPDDLYPGLYQQRLQFFLPTGHYATMLLKQLIITYFTPKQRM